MNVSLRSRWMKVAAFTLCSCVAGVLVAAPKKKPASSCEVIDTSTSTPGFTRVATLRAMTPVANVLLGRSIGAATLTSGEVVAAVGSWMETETVEVFLLDPKTVSGTNLTPKDTGGFTLTLPSGRHINVAVADVNEDCLPDIVVGHRFAGRAFLFLAKPGQDSLPLNGMCAPTPTIIGYRQPAIELPRPEDTNQFGRSLAVGDLIGDGFPEIVVGAPGGRKVSGKVFIFKLAGGTSCQTNTANCTIDGTVTKIDGAERDGAKGGDRFGASVAVGDVTGWGTKISLYPLTVPMTATETPAKCGSFRVLSLQLQDFCSRRGTKRVRIPGHRERRFQPKVNIHSKAS